MPSSGTPAIGFTGGGKMAESSRTRMMISISYVRQEPPLITVQSFEGGIIWLLLQHDALSRGTILLFLALFQTG